MKPLNFANAQTDAKSAHSGPEHRKLIEKYHALFARTRSLEEGQTKDRTCASRILSKPLKIKQM